MPPRKKFQSRSVALPEQDRIALAQLSTELGKLCKLLMRCTIDSNISMMLFFRMLPAAEADQLMRKVHRMAVSESGAS